MRPALARGLDVEAVAQDADLAPGVPVRGHEDLIPVDHVVLERLAL